MHRVILLSTIVFLLALQRSFSALPYPMAYPEEFLKAEAQEQESVRSADPLGFLHLFFPDFPEKLPPIGSAPASVSQGGKAGQHYAWKTGIVTTTFWVGESATRRNPVPNRSSCWDPAWARSYGGADTPEPTRRSSAFAPARFVPKQNPFYFALPYNDVVHGHTKPEAARVIPWFRRAFSRSGLTVLKDRWIAIRRGGKTAYAQWEDAGPFRTDHWQYVFGQERPRKNMNRGAGLDVSPAVRDFLGMNDSDVTDWRFVDFSEVPNGPWSRYGSNNPFVINARSRKGVVATSALTRSGG